MDKPNLKISVSQTEQKEKKAREKKLEEVTKTLCALANEGGTLELRPEENEWHDENGFKRCVEQKFQGLVGTTNLCQKSNWQSGKDGKLIFKVEKANEVCTVVYNLYLSSDTQVLCIQSSESIEDVRRILKRKRILDENLKVIGDHHTCFVRGTKFGLTESKSVQLKKFKSEKTQKVHFHQRLTEEKNKLRKTIVAFANMGGGDVYCGIRDDQIVEGQVVDEREKERVIAGVTKTMLSIIWPAEYGAPQRGVQWEIYFEPVKDDDGNDIPSTFVIVISVAPSPGGVFDKEPESYHIVDGEVKKMQLHEWKSRLLLPKTSKEDEPISKRAKVISLNEKPCIGWSSIETEQEYLLLTEKFDGLREDGKWTEFWKEIKSLCRNKSIDVQLIVFFQSICAAYMRKNLKQAKEYFQKFKRLIEKSENSKIFKVEALFVKASMRRSEGRYDESYSYLEQAVELLETLPPGITTAWVHCMYATVSTILANGAINDEKRKHVQNAEYHYKKSLEHAQNLNNFPKAKKDLREAISIHRAFLNLGSCITEEGLLSVSQLSVEQISALKDELRNEMETPSEAEPRSQFNVIQYELLKSELNYRLFQFRNRESSRYLQDAMNCARNAKELARKNGFEELSRYSCYRLAHMASCLTVY